MHAALTIGPDGLPVIAYHDGNLSILDLKVVRCNDIDCTQASSVTVDSSTSAGTYASITIGADGNPLVAYQDDTNDNLKVLKCTNPLCLNYWARR